MNQTRITFDDLNAAERAVYLKAAQRLLDKADKPAVSKKATQRPMATDEQTVYLKALQRLQSAQR